MSAAATSAERCDAAARLRARLQLRHRHVCRETARQLPRRHEPKTLARVVVATGLVSDAHAVDARIATRAGERRLVDIGGIPGSGRGSGSGRVSCDRAPVCRHQRAAGVRGELRGADGEGGEREDSRAASVVDNDARARQLGTRRMQVLKDHRRARMQPAICCGEEDVARGAIEQPDAPARSWELVGDDGRAWELVGAMRVHGRG